MLGEGYGLMPNSVLLDKELTDKAKIVFCLISSLCAEKGYCRASNDYLAKTLGVSSDTIIRAINILTEKKYIFKKIDKEGGNKRYLTLSANLQLPTRKNATSLSQKCDHINTIDNYNKKEENKKEEIPSINELVEGYKNDETLPKKLKDENLVREWATYKQTNKKYAYKTVKGFLQQLLVIINTIRFGEPRGDTDRRFEFALNQAKERSWQTMYWNEQTEQEYQGFKKHLLLKQRQDE